MPPTTTPTAPISTKLAPIIPTTPLPVPAYGSTVTDSQGRTDQAKFDPNTGKPLTPPASPIYSGAPVATVNADGSTSYNSPLVNGATSTQNSSTGTTGANTGTPTLSDPTDRAALQASQAVSAKAAQDFSDTIMNIQNGVIPLSAGDQAQVQGLKSQWDSLIQTQQQSNNQAQGSAMASAFRGGGGVGSDVMNNISAVVSAGASKIASFQSQEAAAVAQLTQSLKDNDIKNIKTAYDTLSAAQKDSQAALQKTIDDTTSAITAAQNELDKQQQYKLDVAKFNQDVTSSDRDYAEKVKTDAFDHAYKMEDLALKRQANTIAGQNNLPPVGVTATGKPDPASQQAFLNALPGGATGAMATGIKGLTSYTILPNTFSTRAVNGGPSQKQQFVTMAQQYDPTYDENQAPARAAYIKGLASTQAGTVGGAINSANKSINHLTAFVNDLNKTGNTASSTVNWALNNTVGQLIPGNRTTLGAAKTEGLGVADELAKFFKGTGATDVSSVDAWKAQLSTNASPADVKGLTQGAINLLTGQLETLSEQYGRTMGKPATNGLLGPSAIANLSALKNQGYEVNIPGVYYTDSSAYIKNSPDAQTNMKKATEVLQSTGTPITSANVLSMAQYLEQNQ